jgi:hypothetical protein
MLAPHQEKSNKKEITPKNTDTIALKSLSLFLVLLFYNILILITHTKTTRKKVIVFLMKKSIYQKTFQKSIDMISLFFKGVKVNYLTPMAKLYQGKAIKQ